MRIVAGEFRSRRLQAPAGQATRPTSDKLRETLFNVLGPRVDGARFADLYAGSGAVGLEALSRGAAFCCFAENAREALSAIQANLTVLAITTTRYRLETRGVAQALTHCPTPWDVVFLDPPYAAEDEYARTLAALGMANTPVLAPHALVIAEHARKNALPENVGILRRTRVLEQGDATLSFYAACTQT